MPIEVPTTTESITGRQIEQSINATDAEDALKYFPSLNVRKRYIGDHDHAVLATRASGTGNSARSLVFADGVLLSNLLGNGATYTPRWGLVTSEEIERVDVLYGPFSAAFSGNSAGAVVEYVTRMPRVFEAHVKLQGFSQRQAVYATDDRYHGAAGSASLGTRSGGFSWWLNLNRLDNDGHPITFANKLVSAGAATATGTPVTGAVADRNPSKRDWLILGATNQTHSVQDHAKLKLAYDLSPELRASYSFGWWTNTNERTSESYLRDASGNPVYGSNANPRVNIDGRDFTLTAADFAPSRARLEHLTHGVTVKSNTRSTWDVEAAASLYDYHQDELRSPTTFLPNAATGGAGRITDLRGTGWNTLALKTTWRPEGFEGRHIVEAGAQRDAFRLRTRVSNTADWLGGGPDASAPTSFNGNTSLRSVWAQDAWRFAPDWKAVLGLRVEDWNAFNGSISGAALAARSEADASPKAALSWQATADWVLKASVGRAVRWPTVAELYQGALVAGAVVNNDPNLKPERSVTSEWTAERDLGSLGLAGSLRTTLFHERTKDALYSQTNVTVTPNVTNIQNVDAIRTRGIELALQAGDVFVHGLHLTSSLTHADSKITKNDKFPASVGHWQPRVPKWRANLLVAYAPSEAWSGSAGIRYSGQQYGTLDNSDPNGLTYTGVSSFLVADVRLQYRFDKQWKLSAGIDNLNNKKYWAFHPYPQRTFNAELRFDH